MFVTHRIINEINNLEVLPPGKSVNELDILTVELGYIIDRRLQLLNILLFHEPVNDPDNIGVIPFARVLLKYENSMTRTLFSRYK